MMPDTTEGGLLGELQKLANCQYLSDLHSPYYIGDILYAIRAVNIQAYPLEQWEEAYGYITGDEAVFDSVQSLVHGLIRSLESRLAE